MNDSSPVFRPLLAHAWRMSWQYPWLICFGFFASFLSIGGFWELLFQSQSAGGVAARIAIVVRAIGEGEGSAFIRGIGSAFRVAPWTFLMTVLLLLVLLGIVVGMLILAALAYATLIDTTHKILLARRTTFRAAWAIGRRFAPTVFGVHLVIKITIAILFVLTGLLLYATREPSGIFFFLDFLLFVSIVALSLASAIVTMYAVAYAVLRGFTIRESLRAAIRLSLKHWLISIECSALFFLLSFALGVSTLAILLYLLQPLLQLSLLLAGATLPGTAPFILIVWALAVMLFFIAVAAYFTTYQTAAWTLLFLRLTEHGATPKLVRLFHKNTRT